MTPPNFKAIARGELLRTLLLIVLLCFAWQETGWATFTLLTLAVLRFEIHSWSHYQKTRKVWDAMLKEGQTKSHH